MPEAPENPVVLFGETSFRNQASVFGIKLDDRRRHIYIIGKSGMGKSELLKNFAIQDIVDGRGLAFVDPHGDPVEDLLDYIPPERIKDVIYVNPADTEHPISFNIMEDVGYDQRHLVADGMMAVFKKIWVDQWSARMEYILNYTILALLEVPGSTLLGINRMLADKDYRKSVVAQVRDPEVKAFWQQEFAKYTDKFASEATAAIQNKIGQFVSNTLIRNIIGQAKSSFDMRAAMDAGKIILVNISKGRIGEDASRLLGSMLITKIQLAAMSRVDIPKAERKDFTLIVDEFQNFATASFATILSEARKFNLSLIVAHQYIAQLSDEVRDAIFGNVGTLIVFRVGAEDAEAIEKEFAPEFTVQDIVNLGFRQIYLKLMIDGVTSRAFSARTMDTIARPATPSRDEVIGNSRQLYTRSREEVEKLITEWRIPSIEQQTPAEPHFGQHGPLRHSTESRPPRIEPRRSEGSRRHPRPPISGQQGVPLEEAFSRGAVDFKSRPIDNRPKKAELSSIAADQRAEINTAELRDLLRQALDKKEDKP